MLKRAITQVCRHMSSSCVIVYVCVWVRAWLRMWLLACTSYEITTLLYIVMLSLGRLQHIEVSSTASHVECHLYRV